MASPRPKKEKKPKAPTAEKSPAGECFVVMPFGGYFDTYWTQIYIPAISAANLTARRADDIYRPSAIVHDIWELTKNAAIILADLTGRNANVMYELGLAHAITKPVVMVAESMDDVPFDLRALRIITYDKNVPTWAADLGKKITGSIKQVLAEPAKSIPASFLQAPPPKSEVSGVEKQLIGFRQELDTFRQEFNNRKLASASTPPPAWLNTTTSQVYTPPPSPVVAVPGGSLGTVLEEIRDGDTLENIGRRHGLSIRFLENVKKMYNVAG